MCLTGKYIYCFIKEKNQLILGSSSVGDTITPIYTMPYKDISAVVSDTNVFEYDPTRKNVLAHQRVVTKAMENYTLIPVAFGMVSNNKNEIEKIIADNYDRFNEQFDYLKDKTELGLRVTWENEYFNQDIEDDNIKELKEKVAGKDEDEVLVDKIQLGKLVEEAILSKKDDYIAEIYEPLSKIAVQSKLNDHIAIKTIFNSYFLINNSDSELFDQKVEELYKPFENKLAFSYTGPWPPYNFVDMKLNFNMDNNSNQDQTE